MKMVIVATVMAAAAFTVVKAAQVSATPQDPVLAELRALRATVEQLAQIYARLAVVNIQTTTFTRSSASVQQRLAAVTPRREAVAKELATRDAASNQGFGGQQSQAQLASLRAELSRLEQEEQALNVAAAEAANGLLQAQQQLQELQQLLSPQRK